jgi:NADP-dependent 3-hydroxy acid dehydrogenase YdfG
MADPQFLKDKTAIVTGASSGIGRALAILLSKAGARVVLASRNVAALEALAAEINGRGGQSRAVQTDVTRDAEVDGLVQRTIDTWGQIDILVASSGLYVRGPVATLKQADFERAMDVDFFGALRPVLRVLPFMLARHSGHIVLMNSLDGRKALPIDAPYAAAKFALTALGDVLRQDLHGTGVCVTSVYPGRVDTLMIANLRVPWISPKLSPESVARATLGAIRRRDPEVIVPILGIGLIYLNLLPPRFADWCVRVLHLEGWEQQPPGT